MQKSPRVKSNLAVKRNEFEYLLDIRVQQSDVVAGARRKRSTRFRAHLLLPECGWVMAIDCERLSSLVMVFYEGEWRQIKPKQGGFRRFLATFEQLKYCRALEKWSKVKEVFLLEFEFQKSRKTVTLFHVTIMNMCAWIFLHKLAMVAKRALENPLSVRGWDRSMFWESSSVLNSKVE